MRPGDVITAEARVLELRDDKPISTLATKITNQDGVVVLDGTAVVWRDPVVAEAFASPGEIFGGLVRGAEPSLTRAGERAPRSPSR